MTATPSSASRRRPASPSRRWADLPGRPVRLSLDVTAAFDTPLAPHHKLIGRWVASKRATSEPCTRAEARALIESTFARAVADIMKPVKIADLVAMVLIGETGLPPSIAIMCRDVGQIDLGWIEKDNVLSNTLQGPVAPVGWQAAAYQALEATLGTVLPIFGYDDMIEEYAAYQWDGETSDEGAIEALKFIHGNDLEDLEVVLPSHIAARRPAWMLSENAARMVDLPKPLQRRLRTLKSALDALKATPDAGSAWNIDGGTIQDHLPHLYDASHLPPLTLVPFDHFAAELDAISQYAMETSFMDVAGHFVPETPDRIDAWLASLQRGADLLVAAQQLIDIHPITEGRRQ